MSLSFRKSVKIAGIRFNFSKSGVSGSAGPKGAKLNVNSKGDKTVSAGKNGFRWRKKI